ncbi:proline-rich protein 36 [Aplysia californica]|uniref:Proline-rich protein 36 n=1 Tax=Aplysia californica TaxID=6500 RepID=A0ABM0JGN1_APLCA|nr:proline-rich protein 36 [Aplysia californica]
MVRKEDLCDWFKNLQAPKRLDYMCGLLHMCLPLELRFVGSVLEDLAKKDFHFLRDKEIKANSPQDLSSNESSSLADSNLRGKFLIALALMNSANVQCADIIYSILKTAESHFESLAGSILLDKKAAEEIELILTMAVHHPAFKMRQKLYLGDIQKLVQRRIYELHGSHEERELLLPPHGSLPGHVPVYPSQTSPVPQQSERVLLKSLEIKGIREEPKSRKDGPEFQIQTVWSNGEIMEVYMKFKQLQDLHQKLLYKFPEEKKQHKSIPVFPGKQSFRNEADKEKINSLNSYFRELVKAPSHILNCDVLLEPLRRGSLVQPTSNPPQSCIIMPRSFYEENGWIPQYTVPPYARLPLCSNPSSPGQLTSPSQVSSCAESPANSRTSSPALAPHHASGVCRTNLTSPGARAKGPHIPLAGGSPNVADSELGSNVELSLSQLLRLLGLEKYFDCLRSYSFKQILSMSKDDFAAAGLPADAQDKLRSKLDQYNQSQLDNGHIDTTSGSSSAEISPSFPYSVVPIHRMPFIASPQYGHTYVQFAHSQQPSQASLLASPNSHTTGEESSSANSEVSSPPASPSQINLAAQSVDLPQVPPIMTLAAAQVSPGSDGAPLAMMAPPAAVAASSISPSDVKLLRSKNSNPPDSSGSEEDMVSGYDQSDSSVGRSRGLGRPQQSFSQTGMSGTGNPSLVVDEGKVVVLPISMSGPSSHIHSALVSVEASNEHTPPPNVAIPVVCASSQISTSAAAAAALVNGYMSDPPPPLIPQGPVMPRSILNARPFKSAQPTHTAPGMHKNVVNMPNFDHMGHLPQAVGKGPGVLPSGMHSIPHHSFMAPPVVSTATSNQGLVLGPGSHQSNNNNVLPQPPPQHPPHMSGLASECAPASSFHSYPLIMRPPNLPGSLPPQRSILTSVASSSSAMTSSQCHSAGPPLSHSPSPVAATTSNDQVPTYLQGSDMSDPRCMDRASTGTPPSQTPPHLVSKPTVTASTSGTNTPSPPLNQPLGAVVPPQKQHSANCLNCDPAVSSGSGGHPVYFHHQLGHYWYHGVMPAHNHPSNGLVTAMPPFFPQPQASQPFPNGMNPELYMAAAARFPAQLAQGQLPPFLYGNSYPTHNQVMPQSNLQTNAPPPVNASLGHGPPNNGATNKIACYNCGNTGHKVAECKESTMENMSKTYRLNFKPKSDSE